MASERKNRRGGDENGVTQKKGAVDQEQEQEIEAPAVEEPEHARLQNQMGNEGLNAIFGIPSVQAGTEFGSMDMRDRAEEVGVEYGGDDDADPAAGITLTELVTSWNPGIKKSADRTAFADPMPSSDLPPADESLRERVRAERVDVPMARTVDALVQPPIRVLGAALGAWSREIGRWVGPGLARRAHAHLLRSPPPVVGDPWGRPLVSKTRIAALATWLLLDSPALEEPGPATAAYLQLCLDLAGGEPFVRDVWIAAQELGNELPLAAKLLETALPDPGGRVRPEILPGPARVPLGGVLEGLLDLPRAVTYLPVLVDDTPEADPEDDDAFAALFGAGDPEAALYDGAVQGAERLAAHGARMRVQLAGCCAAISHACAPWSAGSPNADLLDAARRFDDRIAAVLQLLVEVARAAQKRAVVVRGLQNGLKRAAGQIDGAVDEAVGELCDVIGGVLPLEPEIPLPPRIVRDALTEAWEDGTPAAALPWLRALPASLDRDAAIVLTRAAAGEPAAGLADPLLDLRRAALGAGRSELAAAAGHLAGPALLWGDRFAEAADLADELLAVATGRRNGVAAADAAILGFEAARLAGRPADVEARRLAAGRALFWGGSPTGFELVLRWTAPVED